MEGEGQALKEDKTNYFFSVLRAQESESVLAGRRKSR